MECSERKLAHSLRLALPRMMAPCARSPATSGLSRPVTLPARAWAPAVVARASAVSMLSLIRIGTPCREPRISPLALAASAASAAAMACGLMAITAFSWGPARSRRSMRSKYWVTRRWEVVSPRSRLCTISGRVADSSDSGRQDSFVTAASAFAWTAFDWTGGLSAGGAGLSLQPVQVTRALMSTVNIGWRGLVIIAAVSRMVGEQRAAQRIGINPHVGEFAEVDVSDCRRSRQ